MSTTDQTDPEDVDDVASLELVQNHPEETLAAIKRAERQGRDAWAQTLQAAYDRVHGGGDGE